MLRMLLTAVQVFSSLAILGLVLLQRGKGADAGAGFGSGASGTVFGARGATTALSRATAVFAAIFMINSLALAYLGTTASKERQKTILEEAADSAKPPAATGTQPPGNPPASLPASAPAIAPAPATTPAAAPAPVQPPK